MKRIIRSIRISLLFATAAMCGNAAEIAKPAAQSFLFIGNSFTFRHELKDVFKTLAKEGNPGMDFITERITYGGRDMFRHFELFRSQDLLRLPALSDADLRRSCSEMEALAQPTAPAFYHEYWKNIDASALKPWEEYEATNSAPKRARAKTPARKPTQWMGDRQSIKAAIANHEEWIANRKNFPSAWNYVVLQTWQDVSANPETGYLKYATKFAELARQQNTKVILYITAPYSQNREPVKEPIEKERALMEVRLASELAKRPGPSWCLCRSRCIACKRTVLRSPFAIRTTVTRTSVAPI